MPQEREHSLGIPVGGIVLLFLGVVFLLQTLHVIPWGLWGTLWRYWPVVLIIVGLSILLRHHNIWLVSLLILAILFATVGLAYWQYHPGNLSGDVKLIATEPLDGIGQAQVNMDFKVGSLTVASLPSTSPNLVEVDSNVNGNRGMAMHLSRDGDEATLSLSKTEVDEQFGNGSGEKWQAKFNRSTPLTMKVDAAVGKGTFDLGQLQVPDLNMDLDVGDYNVTMPHPSGTATAFIKVNLSNLKITIPENVAVRIKAKMSLGGLTVDEQRFPKSGDYYVSPNYATALNRLDMEIDSSLSRVQIE
ncbi:MAG: DUF5668 domain-containing protein [Chloroflexota bacterium]